MFTTAGNRGGAQDPIPWLRPCTKLSNFHPLDPLTPHHHRGAVPQTVGPEPLDTEACPPPYKWLGTEVNVGQTRNSPKCINRHESARQNDKSYQ